MNNFLPKYNSFGFYQILFSITSLLFFSHVQSQTQTVSFISSGTFVVPNGVTSITVECVGGGGGGSRRSSNGSGGGGGGGAYARSVLSVSPGNCYAVVVGTGGSGSTGTKTGGNSSFGTDVVAVGGGGGTNDATAAGLGGAAASCTGQITRSGGNGATGGSGNSNPGGGGGAAGATGNGNNGGSPSVTSGGAGNPPGGSGANASTGGVFGNSGNNGNEYGGGGSGARRASTFTYDGGNGASGLVRITYTGSAYITYCTPSFTSGVEPITNVTFSSINNNSPNALGGSALESFCNTASVSQGSSHTITVSGNTGGDYTNTFRVFFDWNQNGVYTDPGESYLIGNITNSTGIDGKTVSATIDVPATASLGVTRMRVMKRFNADPTNPCQTGTGFGQAEEYLVDVVCPTSAGGVNLSYPSCSPQVSVASWAGTLIWQGSTNNSTFTDIAGETSPSYNIPSNSPYLYFRFKGTLGTCSDIPSNSVQVIPANYSGGGNITINTNTTMGGVYNLGTKNFTVNASRTLTVAQGCPLEINANNITINGTINGNAAGRLGGVGGSNGENRDDGSCNAANAFSKAGTGGSASSGSGGGNGGGNGRNGTDNCASPICDFGDANNVTGAGGGGAGQGGGYGGKGGSAGTEVWTNASGGAGGGINTGAGSCGSRTTCNGSTPGASTTQGCPGAFAVSTSNTFGTASGTDFDMGGGGGGAGGGGGGYNAASGTVGSGGNGGGAVRLKFSGAFTMGASSAINVNGGNGGKGGNGGSGHDAGFVFFELNKYGGGGGGGGAGGGSGGAVFIEAAACSSSINISAGAQINANGGNGGLGGDGGSAPNSTVQAGINGKGGGGGGGGRVKIFRSECGSYVNNGAISVAPGNIGGTSTPGDAVAGTTAIVEILPLASGSISAVNPAVCFNASGSLNGTDPSGGACTLQYQWFRSNSSCAGGPSCNTLPTANVETPPAGWCAITGATNVSLTSTGALNENTCFIRRVKNGACVQWSNVVTITVNALPTASPNFASNPICNGSSVLLSANATAGSGTISTYAWSSGIAGNNASGNVSASGTYTVTVTNSNGCSVVATSPSLSLNALPTASPNFASNPICNGSSVLLSANATAGSGTISTYAWSSGIAGNNASGNVSVAGTYMVTVTNSNGCSVVATSPTLTFTARPTASLSGTTTICNGLDATLTITATGTAPFSGTLSDGTPFSGSSPITVSISPTATTTYTIATLSDANCTATSGDLSGSATVTVNNCALTWNGSQSTSWNNPLNWTPNIVPNNCALDVIIPSVANQPEIGNATYAIGNLNIADDAFVLFSNSNARLNICGNIVCGINNGSKFVGLGRAVMQGSAAQSISGNLRADILRLNNASGAGFAPKALLEVGGILELENGTFNTAGGILRFISTSVTSCAILDNFSAGFSGTVNGSIEAQRYYEAATDTRLQNQHYFGSPVDAPPVTQFAPAKGVNGVAVTPTNDCDETQTAANGNYGNVFEWEEGLVNTCYLQGWRVRSAGNAQNARGYSVVKQGSGTLTLTGAANLDAQYQLPNLTNGGWLHSSKQGNQFNSGWSLAANPYLAPIDLEADSNAAFDDFVLVLRTHGTLAGSFQPISMSGSGLIAPFQGFLVRKSDDVFTSGYTPATFKVNAADRRVGIATFHKNDEHQLSLKVSGNGYADVTYFNFNPASTEQYDPKFDALKAASSTGQPTLFSFIVGSWASVNTHPDVQSTPYIPLGFRPGKNGTFLLEGEGFADLPNTIVFLEDKKENIMHNLTQVPEYTFTSNKSDAADRFVLHFNYQQPSGTSNIGHSSPDIRLFPNPASGLVYIESQQPTANSQDLSVEVFDISGRKVAATFRPTNSGAGTLEVSLLPSAVYQVRITAASGTVVKRLVKE